jgi:hypothetical protein
MSHQYPYCLNSSEDSFSMRGSIQISNKIGERGHPFFTTLLISIGSVAPLRVITLTFALVYESRITSESGGDQAGKYYF